MAKESVSVQSRPWILTIKPLEIQTARFNLLWIVIVESSLIFIRGCNSLKLCLYFPENAPGTRNKISRKRDLWSPNMTHSDLNLLAWCYVANQNTNRRNLDKTHTALSNRWAWLHYPGDNGEKWIDCEALSDCLCTRDVSIMASPHPPPLLSSWSRCTLATLPGSLAPSHCLQPLDYLFALLWSVPLPFPGAQLATAEGRACLYQ